MKKTNLGEEFDDAVASDGGADLLGARRDGKDALHLCAVLERLLRHAGRARHVCGVVRTRIRAT